MSGSSEINMADVAERAGVSTATVSRALRDLPGVSEGTRQRIKEIADELAYVISPEASRLARGATGRIAVVAPRMDVWFYSKMLANIESVLSDADLDVLMYQVDGLQQRNRFFRDLPARRKVDAVVLIALPVLHDEVERLDLMGVEVVVAGGEIGTFPHVRVDDHAVGVTAIEHLLSLGHERIAMLRTSDTDGAYWSADSERSRGYRTALEAAGIRPDPRYLVTEPFGPRAGAAGMARLLALESPPTAVFAYSDEVALGAYQHLLREGIRVPEEMSLVGVDGHPLAELFGLSSIVQAVGEQGRLAGRMVLDLLAGVALPERHVVVPTRLELRGSTAPPSALTLARLD
ncbi:LacI family DNA-binding transcriptional regulator [Nocardioides sp.]|uniref:LacI family DNA-binding transcriptional regulator n=1 Tax=Nocardioides sp. TaxID=35761 RepID=UPI003D0B8AA9